MPAILPEPTDLTLQYKAPKSSFDSSRVRRTFSVLIILVIIAAMSLVAGFTYDVIHSRDQDNIRKQDLSYIAGVLNGYYNLFHYYPTLNQINSSTFGAFAPSVNRDKFKDPSSNNSSLLSQPAGDGYAYELSPSDCNNTTNNYCTSYTLVAILSSSKDYKVVSPH